MTDFDPHNVLDSVKTSGVLGKSNHQVRLLEYLLTEVSEGRGERLKSYSIAVDALERGADFDASSDSIVRVEMHRLRKNIAIYNRSGSEYIIDIAKGSFILNVQKRTFETKSKSFLKKIKFSNILIGLLSLLVIGLFITLSLRRQPAPIDKDKTFRPIIALDYAKDNPYASEMADLFYNRLAADHFVALETSLDAFYDYILKLEVFPVANSDKYNVLLHISDRNGRIVWSNKQGPVDITAPDFAQSYVEYIQSTMFNIGMLSRHFTSNRLVAENRNKLFRCYYDLQIHTLPDSPRYLDTSSWLDCLNPNLSSIPGDKALIHIARADYYSGTITKHFNDNIKNAFELAEKELAMAESYSADTINYLYLKIRMSTLRHPMQPDEVKKYLDLSEAKYPENILSKYLVPNIWGTILGDWSKFEQSKDEFIGHRPALRPLLSLNYAHYAIYKKDWEEALSFLQEAPNSNTAIHLASSAAILCHQPFITQDISALKQALKEKDIYSPEAIVRYLKQRNYHPQMINNMTGDEAFQTCPIFND